MSAAEASDEDLLRAWRRGDRDAGGRLLARSARSLHAVARAICGDPSLAEEATQEAFARIVRGVGRFRDGGRFRPWAYAIARRAAWDQVRRRRPERALHEAPSDEGGGEEGSDPFRREDVDRLVRAIDDLPATMREVVVLHYGLGLDADEVAAVLDIAKGALWTRLSRARAELKRRLLDDHP